MFTRRWEHLAKLPNIEVLRWYDPHSITVQILPIADMTVPTISKKNMRRLKEQHTFSRSRKVRETTSLSSYLAQKQDVFRQHHKL